MARRQLLAGAVRGRPEELPGVHFATAVVELLLCFDWHAPHGHGEVDLEEENALTVHRKNPLVLVAKRRCVT
jgi:hypothetical protein